MGTDQPRASRDCEQVSRPWVCRPPAPHLRSQARRGTGHGHSCWPRVRTSRDRSQSQGARGRGRAGTAGLSPGRGLHSSRPGTWGQQHMVAWPSSRPLPALPGQHSPLTVPACRGSEACLAGASQQVARLSVPMAGTGLAAREAPAALEAAVTAAASQACPAGALPAHRVTGGAGGLGVAAALCGNARAIGPCRQERCPPSPRRGP